MKPPTKRQAENAKEYYLNFRGLAGRNQRLKWFGRTIVKYPVDILAYQSIIAAVRPELIFEAGTRLGGSALFFAHMLDLLGEGTVVTIDVKTHRHPRHPRIRFLQGSSTDPGVVDSIYREYGGKRCLVSLDSSHKRDHVYKELSLYQDLVSQGSYMVVEDTIRNLEPWSVEPDTAPGPWEAVQDFLKNNPGKFVQDQVTEPYMYTLNYGGWLRKL